MVQRPPVGPGILLLALLHTSLVFASGSAADPCADARVTIDSLYHAWQDSTPASNEEVREQALRKTDLFRRQEAALESRFDVTLDRDEIVAERLRIETDTHRPDRLRELYDALGHDRWLVEQCLIRPLLVERRFAGAWTARDAVLSEGGGRRPVHLHDPRDELALRRRADRVPLERPGARRIRGGCLSVGVGDRDR